METSLCWEETCLALGGRWQHSTCAEDLRERDPAWHEAVRLASQNGSCSETRVDGQKVVDVINWRSRMCCASYPANACYPRARKMKPCKNEADFKPEMVIHEYCTLDTSPDADACVNHNCDWNEEHRHCHCDSQGSCLALGGRWHRSTCAEDLRERDPAWHEAVRLASQNGSCSETRVDGQKVVDVINWRSRMCCASYPANACYPRARKMTPCKNEADFQPENMVDKNYSCGQVVSDWDPLVHVSIIDDCLGYDWRSIGRACCIRDPVCEIPAIYFELIGSLLLGLGAMGVMIATWCLHIRQGVTRLEFSDEELISTTFEKMEQHCTR